MGGFFSALFGGQDSNLNDLISQFKQVGQQQTGQGQKNENAASGFWNSILSGDSSKISQTLAPEISAAKTSAAQTNKTNSVFGNRSGGTAASASATNDKVHSDITNLIGSLTNSSASSLASLGSNQIGTGLGALNQEQAADTQRMENWSNSIFGMGLSQGAGFAEGMGMSYLQGKMGGGGGQSGNGI